VEPFDRNRNVSPRLLYDETYAMSFVAQSTVSPEMRIDTGQVAPASFPATPTNDYKCMANKLDLRFYGV
jgi:hypothetical protein